MTSFQCDIQVFGSLGPMERGACPFDPVALDCQMAKYVRSIFRDVRLARRQHQITDGGLTASPAQKRAKNVDGKKGACKNN